MASSVWSTVQGTVVPSSFTSSASSSAHTDPTALLHQQLASALSTAGDAQFWEETISPSTIRTSLASSDPSNANSTPTLLRGMKWLLASISKGRDVSDFYPHVVKLVGASSLEVRKMVYVYLVQYADHDSTTRELSLLSINSFQRGLADTEPWIRALALRVLTSIRIADILQIQILGVQTCAKDRSPYVRKCAANALAKLYGRCDLPAQREMLLDIMILLLEEDTSTMVLTSAIIAFSELCPGRLELLHNPYRKICHLLTDMDEWGQVIVLDLMARYCRKFFKKPAAWRDGTAEQIDRERRVRRTTTGIASVEATLVKTTDHASIESHNGVTSSVTTSTPNRVSSKRIKRRVVRKGFYSDEEDESTEEEVSPLSALRQPNLLLGNSSNDGPRSFTPAVIMNQQQQHGEEDLDLDEDHRLLLRSSLPLLKSRNSAVVMSVCSLHYYCGVSSVKIRSAMGKALVRIHRDRREIQYVVLTSIRTLVQQCPSAFGPFLNDFFVKAMDPPFTRIIKLDILTSLALEPAAIEAVLKELRTYIRSSDKVFVCAAVRAVGKVAELARIVYDRHGVKHGQQLQQRKEANRVALDCLYGLYTLTQASDYVDVAGECVMVMERIMQQLISDASITPVEDPNGVLGLALRRIIILLTRSLSSRSPIAAEEHAISSDELVVEKEATELEQLTLPLGSVATASMLWIFGECLVTMSSSLPVLKMTNISDKMKSKMKLEVIRLVAQCFPDFEAGEKEQGIHLASKLLLSASATKSSAEGDAKLIRCCELVLSMGRLDVNPIVRDRARHESLLLDTTVRLKYDREGLDGLASPPTNRGHVLTKDDLNRMLLAPKRAPSHLPLNDDDEDATIGGETTTTNFRFGTLSSLVGHKAGSAYLPLPPWSEKNSPSSLRDGSLLLKNNIAKTKVTTIENNWQVDPTKKTSGFYESSGEEESDDDGDADDETDDEDDDDDDDDDSDESEQEESEEDNEVDDDDDEQPSKKDSKEIPSLLPMESLMINDHPMTNGGTSLSSAPKTVITPKTVVDSDDDDEDESSEDDDSSDENDSSDNKAGPTATTIKEGNLLDMFGTTSNTLPAVAAAPAQQSSSSVSKYTSVADDLSGLVMAPLDLRVPDIEKDSSAWLQLVRTSIGGGLDIKARFLRGPSKEQEARRIGLDPDRAGTICLQVRMYNIKTDSTFLRRIRLLQRPTGTTSAASSTISPRKVVLPGEVSSLAPQQAVLEVMGLDFASVPDRDGSCMVKLEMKHGGSGGIPVDLKIPLAELLRPNAMTQQLVATGGTQTFDAVMQRLQGFQRVSTSVSLPSQQATVTNDDTDGGRLRQQILQAVLANAALVPLPVVSSAVTNEYWSNGQLRLVASLPASGDPVFVLVAIPKSTNASAITSTNVTVCCDNALAVNCLVDVLKRAIQSAVVASE